jgi:nicotinamide-nucleotide amidase
VRARLGDHVYGADGEPLPAVVGGLLRSRRATLALAESLTGGLVGHLITEVPGASAYLLGAVVAYSDEAKTALLGVERHVLTYQGAVSEAAARQMAEGVRRAFGAEYGLSTTGIAGPGGGSEAKPVGTVHLALAGPEGTVSRHLLGSGDRHRVKLRAAWSALDLLRRALKD